uniref:Uncharacterized protein n=1 Tax=Plectus sambesii TaxID=2011161 RepID=A0A914VF04_9BILA
MVKMAFQRRPEDESKEPLTHTGERFIPLEMNTPMRRELIELLEGNDTRTYVQIKNAFPLFMVVPNEGQVRPALSLLN